MSVRHLHSTEEEYNTSTVLSSCGEKKANAQVLPLLMPTIPLNKTLPW